MTDQAVILSRLEAWAAAVRARDIDGVLRHHDAGIRVFDVVPPLERRGLAAYRASWEDEFFPWMGANGCFEIDDVQIATSETVAFVSGIIRCAGYERGTRVQFGVRLTVGLEKRDGDWVVVHEHHSEPVTASPALATG